MALVGKDQLVHEVSERSGLEIAEARRALEEMLGAIEAQLAKGNEVRLTGFGKFSVSRRKARNGRNPQTGESMKIAAKKVPHFSAGAELRKAVPPAPQERSSSSEPEPAIDTTETQASATSQTKQAPKLSGAKARPQKKRGSRKATTDAAASEDEASPVTPAVKSALVAVAGLAAGVAGGLAIMHRR